MLKRKKLLFFIPTLFLGVSLTIGYAVSGSIEVDRTNNANDKSETTITTDAEYKEILEYSNTIKQDLDAEVDPYTTKEIIDREIKATYISKLKEDERYVITYEPYVPLKCVAMISAESGNGPVKIETIDELVDRLERSDVDFYLPAYMPEGFELKNIEMNYYSSYSDYNLSTAPIRKEQLDLKEGATIKVYKMQEDYKNNVEHIYLQYSDGKNIINYSFGLSGSSGYDNNQNNNQFMKGEFDDTFVEKNRLSINQKILPKESYSSFPNEEGENTPNYYSSIEMKIKMKPGEEELEQEELIKIANSIYKVN